MSAGKMCAYIIGGVLALVIGYFWLVIILVQKGA